MSSTIPGYSDGRAGLVASINRNFAGIGRELFTDTGQYVLRFDAAGTELQMPPGSTAEVQGQSLVLPTGPEGALTLDQRAMVSSSVFTSRSEIETSGISNRNFQ